jgi:hypothetical protein
LRAAAARDFRMFFFADWVLGTEISGYSMGLVLGASAES